MRKSEIQSARAVVGAGLYTGVKSRRAKLLAAAVGAVAMSAVPSTYAADVKFSASVGNYGDPTSWAGGVVPGPADQADISNAGFALINPGDTFAASEVWAGNTTGLTYGVLQQSGGTLAVSQWFVVGRGYTQGEYDLSGGTLAVGTTATAAQRIQLIGQAGNTESAIMRLSGTGAITMTNSGPFVVADGDANGSTAASHLYIQDQASITCTTNEFWIGETNNSTGVVDMSGGTLTVGNWLAIGRNNAVGTLNLSAGTVTKTGGNGNHVTLGSIGGNGTINQTGGTFNTSGADVYVGETGPGTWIMTGGTTTALQMRLAQAAGGIGTLNLSGGTLATTGIQVGAGNASASSLYLNGTTVKALASTTTFLNGFNNSNASVGPNGAAFDVNGFAIGVPFGLNGSGGLTVSSSANGSTGSLTLVGNSNYSGATLVNGGILALGALNGATAVLTNTPSVTVNSGGALVLGGTLTAAQAIPNGTLTINPGGGFGLAQATNTTFSGPLPGGATIFIQAGTGTVTLNGTTPLTGVQVSNGALAVTNASVLNTLGTLTLLFPGALAVPAGSENQQTASVISNNSTGVFALTADTSNNLNFSNTTAVRLGAYPAGATINYSGVLTPIPIITAGTQTGNTLVLGGGGGRLNFASQAVDVGGFPTTIDINAGPVSLTNATNSFTGPILVQPNGTFIPNDSLGTLGNTAAVRLQGGIVQYAAGDLAPLDITQKTVYLQGNSTIDTNGNSVTFAGPIAGQATGTSTNVNIGSFTKAGLGTLNDSSTIAATAFFVKAGGMTFSGNGSGATLNNYTSIGVVPGDNGTLTLDNGAQYKGATFDFNLADVAGGTATNVGVGFLKDTNNLGTLLTAGAVYIGKGGTGTNGNNANGTFTQTGGTFNASGNVQVGVYGTGTYNQTGGTFNVTSFLSIGRYNGGTGTYLLSGGTLNAANAPYAIVGEQGTGTMTISGTGVLNAQGFSIAHNDGGNGTVNQTGGTVNAPTGVVFGTIAGGLTSTVTTVGLYNLSGGTLITPAITRNNVATVSGTVNFNGSTVLLSAGGKLLNNLTAANVMTGGAIINTNGFNTVLNQGLTHDPSAGAAAVDGGLLKQGTGTLAISGTNTYTGATVITGGTLQLTAAVQPLVHFSFDSSSVNGTTVTNDGVGGALYNGTLTGGASITTTGAKFGTGALALNGSSQSVNLSAGSLNLTTNGSWTVSAWENTTLPGAALLYKGNGQWNQGNTEFYAGLSTQAGGTGSDATAVRWGGGFRPANVSQPSITDGNYHLVTYTANAGTLNIYVDGQLVSGNYNPTFGTADVGTLLAIGSGRLDPGDGPRDFNGTIDEVRLDNSGLSAAQVQQLYTTNTVIQSGASNFLPVTTALNVATGATFDMNGINQTVASLTGVAGSAVTLGGGTLTVGDPTSTLFSGSISGTGGLVKVGAGTLTLASGVTTGYNVVNVGPVNISAGTLSLGATGVAANHTVLVAPTLTIGAGRLDIGNGDAILPGASLTTINGLVGTGFANNTAAVYSSAAAANSAHTTAVAVVSAGQVGLTTFDGMAVSSSTVLVKYTYFGDANLDGKVDGSDYSRIDNGYITGTLTGWANGDFNYDGKVDASDYTLIDNAFNRQAATLTSAALVASPTALIAGSGSSAVPEPASLGLLVAASAMVGRRRRR